MQTGFNPYSYNPMLEYYFGTNESANLPDEAAKVAAENPQIAPHINSVWSFMEWFRASSPAMYDALLARAPELTDPVQVVTSGALDPKSSTKSLLSGLDETTTEVTTTSAPATDWGTQILDFTKSVFPVYYQHRAQRDILEANLKRAEQGLPPLDPSGVAPQVNFGLSPGVQKLAMWGIGGLILMGLIRAVRR